MQHEPLSIEFDGLTPDAGRECDWTEEEEDWLTDLDRAKKESQIVAVAKNEAFPPPGKVIFSSLGGPPSNAHTTSNQPRNENVFLSHTHNWGVVCEK